MGRWASRSSKIGCRPLRANIVAVDHGRTSGGGNTTDGLVFLRSSMFSLFSRLLVFVPRGISTGTRNIKSKEEEKEKIDSYRY